MNEYIKQAKDFLSQTGTTLEYIIIGDLLPNWSQDGDKPVKTLSVTLKNGKHTYNFNFHCSQFDTYGPYSDRYDAYSSTQEFRARGKWRKAMSKKEYHYDILACLNVDHSEDFEDFCESFGYDSDSISGRDVYLAVRKETKNLKRLWTEKELELLNEIN